MEGRANLAQAKARVDELTEIISYAYVTLHMQSLHAKVCRLLADVGIRA
jgi:hypothetical protein